MAPGATKAWISLDAEQSTAPGTRVTLTFQMFAADKHRWPRHGEMSTAGEIQNGSAAMDGHFSFAR